MTDWTTPKDWAVLEQVTAANMNTVRDNLKYLKEIVDNYKVIAYQASNDTEQSHAGDTNWTATSLTKTVTLAATSTVVVMASFQGKSNAVDNLAWYRIYRDSTGIGNEVATLNITYEGMALVAVDAGLAAGTYDYTLYIKINSSGGGGTVYVDQGNIVVITIQD